MTYFLLCLLFAFFLIAMIALLWDANHTTHDEDLWEQRDIHIPGLRRPLPEDIHDEQRLKYWQDIYDHQHQNDEN